MTKGELSAQAANLERATQSVKKCSSATVESLKAILLCEAPALPKIGRMRAKPVVSVPTNGKNQGTTRTKRQNTIAICEGVDQKQEAIGIEERIALATITVNNVLKSLTEATKNTHSHASPHCVRTAFKSSSANCPTPRSQTPLQLISVNQNATPRKNITGRCSSTDGLDLYEDGLRAQARCAQVAFVSLRVIYDQEKPTARLPALQLEKGMSALIQKFIAVGFYDLALKEIRILKRRLLTLSNTGFRQIQSRTLEPKHHSKDRCLDVSKESMASLLSFGHGFHEGEALSLVTTTQIQLLKILASVGVDQPHIILEQLSSTTTNSLVNLIHQKIKSKQPHEIAKAASDLEIVAQLVLRICDKVSSLAKSSKDRPNPVSAEQLLQMQTAALAVRAKWWKLSGHEVQVTKDAFTPLNQFLEGFKSTAQSPKLDQYRSAQEALEAVTALLRSNKTPYDEYGTSVYQILAEFAQAAGQFKQGAMWIQKAIDSYQDGETSTLQRCAMFCRKITLQLSLNSDKMIVPPNTVVLSNAADQLAGNLHGNPADLDELLVVITSLRKSLIAFILKTTRDCEDRRSPYLEVIPKCLQLVSLSVNFTTRYLGNHPTQDRNEKTMLRYAHRMRLILAIAKPMIEAVISMARSFARSHTTEWTIITRAVNDCVELAISLQELRAKRPDEQKRISDTLTSLPHLSDPFWYRYICLKGECIDCKEQKQCLKASIDILQLCNPQQQIAHSLSKRLAHYGKLLEMAQDHTAALKMYGEALHLSISLGIVAKAASAASTRSMVYVLDEDEDFEILARTLDAYSSVALKLKDSNPSLGTYFDVDWISIDHRILLLGHQLSALAIKLESSSRSSLLYETAHDISRCMLDLCDKGSYPVQRLHVITQMFYLQLSYPGAVEELALLSSLAECVIDPVSLSGTESGLHTYAAHLSQCRDLFKAVCKQEPDVQAIERVLTAWTRILHESLDPSCLRMLIYDMKAWYLQLEIIIGFLGLQNLQSLRCLALYVYTGASELSGAIGGPDTVLNLIQLASQYIKLGYCGLGGKALQRADRYLEGLEVGEKTRICWHLANAEMALEINSQKGCNNHLETIRALLQGLENKQDCRSSTDRMDFYVLKADTDLIHSTMAAADGNIFEALLFARLGVKGYRQVWSVLRRRQAVSHAAHEKVSKSCQDGSVREGFSTPSITDLSATKPPIEHVASKSTVLWNLVPRLFNSLIVLCSRFAYAGLYLETKFHLDEARKIAEEINIPYLLAQHLALDTVYSIGGGNAKLPEALLRQAQSSIGRFQIDPDAVVLNAQLTKLEIELGYRENIMDAFDSAKRRLRDMKARTNCTHLLPHSLVVNDVAKQLDNLSVQDKDHNSRCQANACVAAKSRSKISKSQIETQNPHIALGNQVDVETQALSRAEGEVYREQAIAALNFGEFEMSSNVLEEACDKPRKPHDTILQAVLLADINLRKGIQELALHPTFNILPESAVSHPSICRSGKALDKHKIDRRIQGHARQPKQASSKMPTRNPEVAAEEKYLQLLRFSRHSLVGVLGLAQRAASTSALHHFLDVLSRTTIILTSLPTSSLSSPIPSAFVTFATELGRMTSMMQASLTICVERYMIKMPKYDFSNITEDSALHNEINHGFNELDLPCFEADYLNIIPPAWDVLSITLSKSTEELLITKMRSNETTFALRIPLNRQSSLDYDESLFGFVQAKHELQDIVDQANRSSQDARSYTQRAEKKEWWSIRNTLDSRIQNLLANIENIWLGGFRGIFSQHKTSSTVLARFHQSLQGILDKHLPSRQMSSKNPQHDRINIGSHVLELFVGLGSPSETSDLDDQILDLLYFVVDILQFNGERNAYDEIDFDSMVIDTLDALRQYHQVAVVEADEQRRHTILILDKKLHGFPWESLSCVKGQSVSRLPSLLCLRQRVLYQRQQRDTRSESQQHDRGLCIRRQNGAFVLNPAGDLSSTQGNFECNLQGLSGWEGIVERAPQENEFKDYLENHDLFLYFGHGSGNQYIRSRTVKGLDKCAVSLLMGCSSGALTEAGEFEPYGTPIDYMHAGCPALLANLWDVTDKDIDRFAQSVLEKWGLFGQVQKQQTSKGSPVKKSSRLKGKAKAREALRVDEERKFPVSLNEAVAQSRDACILKYLNGAAPVIYGIPVFLD